MGGHVNKRLIFDIGAHTGKDTQFYLRKGFRVVAIEAYAPHVQHIRSQLADDILQRNLVVEEVGIGESPGIASFYVHDYASDWHRSTIKPGIPGKLTEICVRYTDASSLFAKYEVPYYMKIDIEDKDWLAIMAISAERKPTFVSFEVGYKAEECLRHLKSIGYNSFQIVEQHKHHKTRPPFPSREGRFVDVRFDNHMSGLFGFELPNRWEDGEAIKTSFVNLLGHAEQDEETRMEPWYDLHASVLRHRGGRLSWSRLRRVKRLFLLAWIL
jgi:FkbM family methyltransferase